MKRRVFTVLSVFLAAILAAGCGAPSAVSVKEAAATVTVTAGPAPGETAKPEETPEVTREPEETPHPSAAQTPVSSADSVGANRVPPAHSAPQGEGLEETPGVTEEPEETPGVPEEPEETPYPSEETPSPAGEGSGAEIGDLIIWSDPWEYSYSDLMHDAELITDVFPGLVSVDSLAVTADGREIVRFIAGNPEAGKQVFINGGTHGREYITCQLVMKQLVEYLRSVKAEESYAGVPYSDMWDQVAIHVVPMINPDGTMISMAGLNGIQNESVLQSVSEIAAMDGDSIYNDYYLDRWKANALGTDINRNYDAYWEEYNDPAGHPSSDHYKGEYPGSSIEAAAMIQLTQENSFLRTISYHAQGGLIYWNFANIDAIYDEALSFASQLSNTTGYPLDSNFEIIDPAGYSDWGIYRCQIPSVTIEVGYGTCPYLQDQFQTIWAENIYVFETTVLSVM